MASPSPPSQRRLPEEPVGIVLRREGAPQEPFAVVGKWDGTLANLRSNTDGSFCQLELTMVDDIAGKRACADAGPAAMESGSTGFAVCASQSLRGAKPHRTAVVLSTSVSMHGGVSRNGTQTHIITCTARNAHNTLSGVAPGEDAFRAIDLGEVASRPPFDLDTNAFGT